MNLMGPEPICSEYVDGKLVDNKYCDGSRSVTGSIITHPVTNFNFDITTYRFNEPGEHTIRWKFRMHGDTGLQSNLIDIHIEPK